jgi:hypothetical protein
VRLDDGIKADLRTDDVFTRSIQVNVTMPAGEVPAVLAAVPYADSAALADNGLGHSPPLPRVSPLSTHSSIPVCTGRHAPSANKFLQIVLAHSIPIFF